VTTPLVVAGAGGFGRETLDVVEAMNAAAPSPVWTLLGVVDDAISDANHERLTARSVPFLGTIDEFLRQHGRTASYVVGIGSPHVRRRVVARFDHAGLSPATLVHPSVTCGAVTVFGSGTVVCAGVTVSTNVRLGEHVHVNPNVTIGHDTVIDDYVSINPLAGISGDCVIESGVLVGVGAIVLNGLRVGHGATLGGAACAVRDVLPGTTVVGVPARPLEARPAHD
jgi:sugar O-acyltransferase (sialic acid O-acetyltransferase NeuD family)